MELEPMMTTAPTMQSIPVIKAVGVNGRSSHNDAVRATPDNVARALESAVRLNFDRYYQKKQLRAKRKGIPPTP